MHPYLEESMKLLPLKVAPFLCQGDLQRIHTGFGKLWYEQGRTAAFNKLDRYADLKVSYEHYIKAVDLNPHDILAVRGVAETVAELEFTHSLLFKEKENPYSALPLYKRMQEVEPNGLQSNYSFAKYLHRKGLITELAQQVEYSASRYPVYGKITSAPFYSPGLREAVMRGLHEALEKKVMVASACFSLSKFYAIEKNYKRAAEYYKKGIETKNKETDRQHLSLANLYSMAGENELAYREYSTYLRMSPISEKVMETVYFQFRNRKDSAGFVEFSQHAKNLSGWRKFLDFFTATSLIDGKKYQLAKEKLEEMKSRRPTAKVFYMLSEVARKEKNWDAMELSIQKATVLDPRNGKYLNILADALIYQKKYRPAAEYLQKALANDPENQTYRKKLNKIRSYNR